MCINHQNQNGYVIIVGKTILGKANIIKHKQEEVLKFGYRCKYCFKQFDNYYTLGAHTLHCDKQPNYNEFIKNLKQKLSNSAQKQKNNIELRKHFSELAKKQGFGGYVYTNAGTRGKNRIAKSGMYKGIWCDSSWELAFIVYNLEHNIKFEKCKEAFEYFSTYDNKTHKYYPDFKLNETTYVEIKGWINDSALIKINEFRKNNPNLTLNIIDGNTIQPYLNYVKEKYGEKFYDILYEK